MTHDVAIGKMSRGDHGHHVSSRAGSEMNERCTHQESTVASGRATTTQVASPSGRDLSVPAVLAAVAARLNAAPTAITVTSQAKSRHAGHSNVVATMRRTSSSCSLADQSNAKPAAGKPTTIAHRLELLTV